MYLVVKVFRIPVLFKYFTYSTEFYRSYAPQGRAPSNHTTYQESVTIPTLCMIPTFQEHSFRKLNKLFEHSCNYKAQFSFELWYSHVRIVLVEEWGVATRD